MNMRRILLTAAFVVLCVMGCTQPVGMPINEAPPDEKAAIPGAPPPRAKKTKAELLVGTWKMVQLNGKDVPTGWDVVREFQADGQYAVRAKYPNRPLKTDSGTYTVKEDTITFTRAAVGEAAARVWDVKIESLSNDELLASGTGKERDQHLYRRVAK
jgi:uncharacterized protein (TIGR03066 family)